MSFYEGTTGIQSLDLLGRKVTINNGKALQLLLAAINKTIDKAKLNDELKANADILSKELNDMKKVLLHLNQYAIKGEIERYLSDATVFMEMASYIVIAWQWLKMANIAKEKIEAADFKTNSTFFYEGKIHTMEFFFKYELPHAAACAETLLNTSTLTNIQEMEMFY